MDPGSEDPRTRRLPGIVLAATGAAVALGCLAFGAPPRFTPGESVGEGWRGFLGALGPLTVLQAVMVLALAALAVRGCLRRGVPVLADGRAARWTLLPLVLLAALAALQLVPLPPGLLSALAPFSATTYDALTSGTDAAWRPMSLWPHGTANALFTLMGMIAAHAAVLAAVRESRRGQPTPGRDPGLRVGCWILGAVAFVAVAECAYGLYEARLGTDTVLGAAKVSNVGRVTGTFIMSAMLAVWAGMGACAALGLAMAAMVRSGRWQWVAAPLLLAAAAVCLAGATFSLSRLGLIATGVGVFLALGLLGAAAWQGGRIWLGHFLRALALAVPVGAAAALLLVPSLRHRADYLLDWMRGAEVPAEPRLAMWTSTLDLFRQAPTTGTGLGSFTRAIHLTQSTHSPLEMYYAHSDVLNLLSDGGVVGFVLGVWWLAAMVWWGRRGGLAPDAATRALSAGATCAAAVVVAAAFADFQTQFPVVAVPLAALLALPVALGSKEEAAPSGDPPPAEPDEKERRRRERRRLVGRVLAVGCAVAALAAAWVPAAGAAERAAHLRAGHEPAASRAEQLAIRGMAAYRDRRDAPDVAAAVQAAFDDVRSAIRLDPMIDRAHLWSAVFSLHLQRDRDEVLRDLGRARWVSRGHADVNLAVGELYLELIGTRPAPHGPEGDGAIAALNEASALEAAAFSRAWELGKRHVLSLEEMKRLVPDRAHALRTLAAFLEGRGLADEALAALERAVLAEPTDSAARLDLGWRLLARGRAEDAARHVRTVLKQRPGDADLIREAARRFREAGQPEVGRNAFVWAGVPWPAEH